MLDVSNKYIICITGLWSSCFEVCYTPAHPSDTPLHYHTALVLAVCLSVCLSVSPGSVSEPHQRWGPAPDRPSLPGRSGHGAPCCNHPLPAPGPWTEGQESGPEEWQSSCIPRSRRKGLRCIMMEGQHPLIGNVPIRDCYSDLRIPTNWLSWFS